MIGVVTDSSCDLPAGMAESHGIQIVPLSIRFGDEEFTDRTELDASAFWRRLASAERLPETVAPSAGHFLEAYHRLAAAGCDEVVAVTLSSRMSATYQAAVIAAESSNAAVRVVDSATASMALGLSVIAAAAAARDGASAEQTAQVAAAAASRSQLIAALDTLDFLKRGGRINPAQALVGGLLGIKPLITVNGGVVEAAGRVRTRAKALDALLGRLAGRHPAKVAVLHTGDGGHLGLMERLAEMNLAAIPCLLGAVIGTHTGPGTLGVAFVD